MIDLVILILIATSTLGAVLLLRRLGARGRALAAAVGLAFFGLVVTLMMGAHSVEITYHLLAGENRFSGEPWQYDFHFYALQLLSGILIWQGLAALRSAWRVAAGAGDRRALRPILITLVLAGPLIPVHAFFGLMYTVLSVMTLLVVGGAGAPALREPRSDIA